MLGKARSTWTQAMLRSTGSMSVTASWRKMASCGDLPRVASQRVARIWGSRWGRTRRKRIVQTIFTSVTAHAMGGPVVRVGPVPFFVERADNVGPIRW